MKQITIAILLFSGLSAFAITPNDPLPTKILSCGGARITEIVGRLEGDPDFQSGGNVGFSNTGVSVAYADDPAMPAIKNSKVGDHVLMCLVYIPKNCPRGDARGKIYTITNLRSLESWTLPDSQHSCGGA